MEIGGDFSFTGNQFRLALEENFSFDTLFYSEFKSLIFIDLKPDKLKPKYAGKMSFYLSVLNDKVKQQMKLHRLA